MKFILFFFITALLSSTVFAQMGVGTKQPQAQLDIVVKNEANPTSSDGLIIPRVAQFPPVNTLPDPDGAMIYLLSDDPNTSNVVEDKGFYYYDNTNHAWKKMLEQAATNVVQDFNVLAVSKIYLGQLNYTTPLYVPALTLGFNNTITMKKVNNTDEIFQVGFSQPITENYSVLLTIESAAVATDDKQLNIDQQVSAISGSLDQNGFIIGVRDFGGGLFSNPKNNIYINVLVFVAQ